MIDLLKRKRKLQEKKQQLLEKKKELDEELEIIREECPHEKVYVTIDNSPHKVGPIAIYYCPICEKEEKVPLHMVDEIPFPSSTIYNLGELRLEEMKEVKEKIKQKVKD